MFLTPAEILADADTRGLRRALVVTALPIEMSAVRAHLTDLGASSGRERLGRAYFGHRILPSVTAAWRASR